ncbi:hypothetical protein, partial [Burkholderia sp. Bp8990]|uniref:hypothetical protein n=1 Tax=Burkholderia sp. Bp8990 TaxID=2184552 RepID=UPI000F9E5FF2
SVWFAFLLRGQRFYDLTRAPSEVPLGLYAAPGLRPRGAAPAAAVPPRAHARAAGAAPAYGERG